MRKYFNILYLCVFIISVSCNAGTDRTKNSDGERQAAGFKVNWEKAWGTPYADDFAGAVTDSKGNIYFTGTMQPDGYAADIFLTKINLSNQAVVWSNIYDSGDKDFDASPSENGHSQGGGGSRCIALDENDNIYIAGTSKNGFNEVFVIKVNPEGDIMWQKVWKPGKENLAKNSSKAYAIDVKDSKVFVTGSTGAGTANEEAMIFLLMLDSENGGIDSNSIVGIDPSEGYNDRGYTIKAGDDKMVFLAGWEGKNNSGFLLKYSYDTESMVWLEKLDIGYASRITDIDIDKDGNIYLAADLRGVSTAHMGVIKTDSDGNILWAKKMQGEPNDRNNISSLRIINGYIYAGGKGSFKKYDLSQYGDGCFYKLNSDGELIKKYNYFTGADDGDRSGERVEAIMEYNGNLIIAGETWPENSKIKGDWYVPDVNISDMSVIAKKQGNFNVLYDNGMIFERDLSVSKLNSATYSPGEGTKGKADILIFSIKE